MQIKAGDIVQLGDIKGQAFKFFTSDKDGRDLVKVACFMSGNEWPINRFPIWPVDRVEKISSGVCKHIGDIDRVGIYTKDKDDSNDNVDLDGLI